MSEQTPAQDRTEKPSPKRRRDATEKGNVAKSQDMNSVAVLFGGITVLSMAGGKLLESIAEVTIGIYRNSMGIVLTPDSAPVYAAQSLKMFASMIAPILIVLLITGVAINVAQVGFVFAKKAMVPKFSKLSPLKGLKRMFSMRSIVELLKGVFKILIVGTVGYMVIRKHLDEYWLLSFSSIGETMTYLGSMLLELSIKIGLVLIVIAIADFAYQKYDHEKNLKMTKQEVKEESKQYEGNPEIKSKLKSMQQQTARARMLAVIPDATVVVTNPTHIAIALKYDPVQKADAPKVLAKGKRKIAQKIKEIAKSNDIPVIENKPLARSLYETTEPGMEIPIIFYEAVAEILAEVYRMNKQKLPEAA